MRAIKLRLGHCLSTIVVLTSALYLSGGSRAAEPSVKKKTEKVLKSFRKHTYKGTLATIQKKRFLRVLTTHNSFNYYIFQGQQKGYEYNIAKRFVKFLNKKYKPKKGMPPIVFEMVPVRRDQLIPMLLDGSGDIIAAGLTATPERMKSMRFTTPYNQVSELLISRETDKSIQQVSDLAGLKIAIRKSSSYRESLERINQQLTHLELPPVQLEFVNEDLETENIVELVALGKYDYTVADSHIAGMVTELFDEVTVHPLPLRESGAIAWAVPPNTDDLLQELNEFLPTMKSGSLLGNINLKKHFRSPASVKKVRGHRKKGDISPYDELFQKYGKQYGWDWRLLTALAYQESRFRQDIKNQWGAIGLLQVKQMVASEPYVNIPEIEGKDNAENNIHAGVKYLSWIKRTYFDSIPDMQEKNRIRLSLAAYNAGPGRIRKALRKTRKMGLNPNKWFRNVELALVSMRKIEPVKYVSDINRRYLSYSLLDSGK